MAPSPSSSPSFLLIFSIFFVLFHAAPSFQLQLNSLDISALLAIKNTLTDVPGTHFFSSWDFASPRPCSTFAGVICSLDNSSPNPTLRVTSLTLGTGLSDSPGLAGSLSASLSNLTQLTQLVLYAGLVTGPIPPQLGNLINLRVLSLTNNRLTGPIPASLSSLHNLHTLDLSFNQLSGSIPPGIAHLDQLKVLILASNILSGELPKFPAIQELFHIDVKRNKLWGRLPSSMPVSLRYLSLVYLDLSMNQFSGPIPKALFHSRLNSMLLQRNNFSGGVPTAASSTSYAQGSIVDLSHNLLTGELSPILAGVETLFLNNNRLIGRVPDEYVNSISRGDTKTLYLQHNYISDFPMQSGLALPDSVSLCLSYNCMVPPVGLAACPASAGGQLSRPAYQCSVYNNGTAP
ncbi:hypothetical protein PVL29_003862 [Vitis rotundifolia]|uniref:Leucine-rich repeat-containing N-terminal plant-type domain-containing protein n=1 Tax=Vitis rotundifolia TaxID=103349 RepID=A0AA39AF89_VITRO|nr:hypothetical protein PVL29_003862 [Vitis rotundifolia]